MRSLAPLLLLVVLALPGAASACAVCIGGQTEETRYAFLWTTGFLSVLPVSMIGGAVWWLRRKAQERAALEAAHTPSPLVAEAQTRARVQAGAGRP